jgi:hypothetical protein
MSDLNIPLFVEEHAGLDRLREPIRLGVPLPRGLLHDAAAATVIDDSGRRVEHQARALTLWPDQSIKWLLLDVIASVRAHSRARLLVCSAARAPESPETNAARISIAERETHYAVDTGAAHFEVGRDGASLLATAQAGGVNLLGKLGAQFRLTDSAGREHVPVADRTYVEEQGPLRASVVVEGHFGSHRRGLPLVFKSRLIFISGLASVRVEFSVRNPRAATHSGGLWDLADPGAVLFRDLSLRLDPPAAVRELRWYAESGAKRHTQDPVYWSLYQDSSGGENWDSNNHVDADGSVTVRFRGYRVLSADGPRRTLIAEGDRATPCVTLVTSEGSIAATVLEFWQNFPKALRWDGRLSVALFPEECAAPFALQGGEQKRHTMVLEFVPSVDVISIPQWQQPVHAWIDPSWVEHSATMGSFVAASRDPNQEYLSYVNAIIEGPNSFMAKRELIDEYGWRNFGDLYADHEAVNHKGPRALVSHYNNQYDFILGALTHLLRTGDARWRRLADEAARHTIDIDVYHTDRDKAAFNHGLFWHTDHYKPAATCTHRTYSRVNGWWNYGGGPSDEHDYTSGLLLYWCLTGDPESASVVRGLGDWVIAMDDGSRTIMGLIDSGPTGLASRSAGYHKPGRGSGNSINALLDAHEVSRDRRYIDKAEQLIRRCIHPADDIEALGLSKPERRWSYLVFLQVLGKYLDFKLEWGETDYMLYYARASLLHYASWMTQHELPYKAVLHKVELPTETWPAHDVRKSHILHLAARYSPPDEQPKLHSRAEFFFTHSVRDVLSFPTAFLTRPLVILCVFGHVHAYFQAHAHARIEVAPRDYAFGRPEQFVPQSQRLRSTFAAKLSVIARQLGHATRGKVDSLRRLLTFTRL